MIAIEQEFTFREEDEQKSGIPDYVRIKTIYKIFGIPVFRKARITVNMNWAIVDSAR